MQVKIEGRNIRELTSLTVEQAAAFFGGLKLSREQTEIAGKILEQIQERLDDLSDESRERAVDISDEGQAHAAALADQAIEEAKRLADEASRTSSELADQLGGDPGVPPPKS